MKKSEFKEMIYRSQMAVRHVGPEQLPTITLHGINVGTFPKVFQGPESPSLLVQDIIIEGNCEEGPSALVLRQITCLDASKWREFFGMMAEWFEGEDVPNVTIEIGIRDEDAKAYEAAFSDSFQAICERAALGAAAIDKAFGGKGE